MAKTDAKTKNGKHSLYLSSFFTYNVQRTQRKIKTICHKKRKEKPLILPLAPGCV